jgi:hypothetical protein
MFHYGLATRSYWRGYYELHNVDSNRLFDRIHILLTSDDTEKSVVHTTDSIIVVFLFVCFSCVVVCWTIGTFFSSRAAIGTKNNKKGAVYKCAGKRKLPLYPCVVCALRDSSSADIFKYSCILFSYLSHNL